MIKVRNRRTAANRDAAAALSHFRQALSDLEGIGAIALREVREGDRIFFAIDFAAHVDTEIVNALIEETLLGESNKPGYTGGHGGPVGDAAEIAEADIIARVRNVPRDKLPALAKLIDDFERTNGEVGASQPAKATPRPDWIEAHKTGEEVPDFIKRAFAAELADGTMHKGLLSRYENLRRDYYSYKRSNELPDWLRAIPKEKDWNDRQVAEGKVAPVEVIRSAERDRKRIAAARRRGVAAAMS
jgi:hypothetical protein